MTHPYTDLKEVAGRATPGPWHFYKGSRSVYSRGAEPEKSICIITGPYRREFPQDRIAIGEYVAAVSPTRILSLIADYERMREALERVKMITQDSTYRACVVANDIARAALKEKPHD